MTASTRAPIGTGRRQGRDGWFDTLRAVALVRVVVYHTFGWVWLPAVFPSMGIMFAMAGALMAASLDRSRGDHWRVIGKRLRRLLPPLWLMGLLLVPVMIWHGWTSTVDAGTPLDWRTLWLWVLPIGLPPGSAWADDWVVPLWYLRTYLWFVLLSPAFLWMLRRWTRRVLAIPLVSILLITAGLLSVDGATGDVVLSLSTFGVCWMLGFAHHDGRIRAMPWRQLAPIGLALLAAGLGWAFTHQPPGVGWNLDEIPLANALYSIGAVLLLMRAHPDFSWLVRRPALSGLITAMNARAVTIYLWNNVAIFLAPPLLALWTVTARWDTPTPGGQALEFAAAWLLIVVAVAALGWVEDVAARRRPRIVPWTRGAAPAAPAAAEPVIVEPVIVEPVMVEPSRRGPGPLPARGTRAAPISLPGLAGLLHPGPVVRTVPRLAAVGLVAVVLASGVGGLALLRGTPPPVVTEGLRNPPVDQVTPVIGSSTPSFTSQLSPTPANSAPPPLQPRAALPNTRPATPAGRGATQTGSQQQLAALNPGTQAAVTSSRPPSAFTKGPVSSSQQSVVTTAPTTAPGVAAPPATTSRTAVPGPVTAAGSGPSTATGSTRSTTSPAAPGTITAAGLPTAEPPTPPVDVPSPTSNAPSSPTGTTPRSAPAAPSGGATVTAEASSSAVQPAAPAPSAPALVTNSAA